MSRTYIKYYHYATLSIDQVLSHVGNSSNHNSIEVNGMNINCYSDRLQTFKLSGTTCHFCGLKALFFTVSEQLSPKSKLPSAHFNLWGYSNGEFVLFTADHIIPKSRGGANNIMNLQTLCGPCNWKKGSKLENF
jgi:hypothetical protein